MSIIYFVEYQDAEEKIWSLKTELNPIRHLRTLLGAHHILHVCRIRVKREKNQSSDWHLTLLKLST